MSAELALLSVIKAKLDKLTPAPAPAPVAGWVRPTDWPAMPTVLETDQKFVGIHAVFENDENFCALSAAGDYTVDWGDGTVENFTANAVAYHTFAFSNASLPVATGRGYKCAVVTVTPQAGQNLTVLNLHKKHNQTGLQAYSSGFLDIAIAGQYITDLRIGVATPGATAQNIRFDNLERINIVRSNLKQAGHLLYSCIRLEVVVNLATSPAPARTVNVTFQDVGDTVTAAGHGFSDGDPVIFSSISGTTGITAYTQYYVINSTTSTFKVATSYGGTAVALTTNGSGVALGGTNFSSMFSICSSLQSVPLLNTAAGTNFSFMFGNCYSLQSVPLLDTAAGTNFSGMFSSCSSLQSVPLLDTAAGKNFGSMFSSCSSLQSVPLLDTAAGTSFSFMFSGCHSLQSVPPLNTAAGTSFGSMLQSCRSLQSVPLLDTAAGKNFSSMFSSCSSLQSVPLLDTAAGTDFGNMFNNCSSLQSVPPLNTAAGTSFGYMFSYCSSLQSVPPLNTAAGTNFSGMFGDCYSLANIDATGFKASFSVQNCKLSADALNKLYTNLPTVTGKTLTVTGNYGTASDNPTIATAKGWTVTG